MRILLLSAYDAASHQRWRQGLEAQFPDCHWTQLSLPPRYFNWRIRGNSLSWAFSEQAALSAGYDLVIATSMVDLSSLRGFIPSLGAVPTLVYFHENQFAYPLNPQQHKGIEPQMVNLYSALCGDLLVFNSDFNRQSFFEGAAALLRKLPDGVPAGLIERMRDRSWVIPVPLEEACFAAEQRSSIAQRAPGERLQLLWNHRWEYGEFGVPLRILWAARWEYDKGPDRLLEVMRELERRGVDYRMCILGEQFRTSPPEFEVIKEEFAHRLVQWGYESSPERYRLWLSSADIVLSTAIHEFQGLAVLEAIAAGCIPVLPRREVYPELVSSVYTYDSFPDDLEKEAGAAVDLIQNVVSDKLGAPDVSEFSWDRLKLTYDNAFSALLAK